MPTYRITDPSGAVLDPAVQADSGASALSGFQDVEAIATQISPNPPAMVYTIGYPLETGRGTEVVEVCTTGSRDTALREMAKQPPGRTLIEETPAANRQAARDRRS